MDAALPQLADPSSPAPAAHSFSDFSHRGRNYQLFLRGAQPNFYIRCQFKGKRYLKALGSPVKAVAVKNAKIWLDALFQEDWAKVEELRAKSPYATLGEIVTAYQRSAPTALKVRNARQNAQALLQIVATARGASRSAVEHLRAEVLTADLVRAYVRKSRADGLKDVSIDSRLTCARSIFSRRSLDNVLRDLKLPDLTEFRTVDCALEPAKDLGFKPFTADQVHALEAMAARCRTEEPGVYLAYLGMARFGLRDAEVWNARWDWFLALPDGRVLLEVRSDDTFRTKNGQSRMIGVPVEVWEELISMRAEGAEYFLPGETMTARRNLVERRLNELVRPILPEYRKGAYELRRWAGSRVYTEQGPAAAKDFLGHASVTTTERYYSRFLGQAHAVTAPKVIAFPASKVA